MYFLIGFFILLSAIILVVLVWFLPSRKVISRAVKNEAILLDVRSQREFEDGSLQGALNIPVDEIESRLEELNFEQNYIVFCSHGIRSLKARSVLRKNDFSNVVNGGAKDRLERKLMN